MFYQPPSPVAAKRFYSTADLRAMLNCSTSTINKWIKTGTLPPPLRPGGPRGKMFWPKEQIDKLLAEMNTTG